MALISSSQNSYIRSPIAEIVYVRMRFQLFVFNRGQKMALRTFYKVNPSQRQLLAAIEYNGLGAPSFGGKKALHLLVSVLN